ncbi:MAG TPA: ABC transporter permease [Candidatus Dormibacteraeota bacterium]|nr:ABC transporter permease [Candidatus Dormibacteraeota bacterium]
MSTQTNAMPGSSTETQIVGPAVIPVARQIYWALRREFWENRFIYLAPLGVAALFLFGFLIHSMIHRRVGMSALSALDPVKQREAIIEPYDMAAALLMGAFILVAVFYSIEALQRERRDRSILFWKSLPVSDVTTVLTKASIPFLVLPLLSCAIAFVSQFLMLLVGSLALAGSGLSLATYWSQVSLFQISLLQLYHVMTVHVLWSAPIYGWLLLVSAWARRAAFLWAVLPPLAIGALEKLLFNTSHFSSFVVQFLSGSGTEAIMAPDTLPMNPMTHPTPGKFLSTPGLWIGLAITAVFLTAAIRLRRYRGPT